MEIKYILYTKQAYYKIENYKRIIYRTQFGQISTSKYHNNPRKLVNDYFITYQTINYLLFCCAVQFLLLL